MLLKICLLTVFIVAGLMSDLWAGPKGTSGRYAAVVLDEKTGKILHAENANDARHPASLTKKMTLLLLFEALKSGDIKLETRFKTSKLATIQIPTKLGLREGDSISVECIIKSLVTQSANDAAVVAAEGLAGSLENFVARMNRTAKRLGMNQTRFYNASGVPDSRQVTTAYDMAVLGRALYKDFPEYYPYFKTVSFQYQGRSYRNHNHMLGDFPGLDGIKTGFVNASGFNISTSAVRMDSANQPRRLFAVVMGGTSWRSRDKQAAQLLEASFRKIGAQSTGTLSGTLARSLLAPGTKSSSVSSRKSNGVPADDGQGYNQAKADLHTILLSQHAETISLPVVTAHQCKTPEVSGQSKAAVLPAQWVIPQASGEISTQKTVLTTAKQKNFVKPIKNTKKLKRKISARRWA
ncbi:MAG: D-alanyl-D-alanine carboxypeptidase [Alphaproteobacteria bacterium]|nr:D-alanyl-D-alanine carboxypeptidase [Alphaproteobacteria bacterium]